MVAYLIVFFVASGTTFVLTPLTYLGGVFYTITLLPGWAQNISHANPILYMVNAFRYGFLGISDSPLWIGAAVLLLLNVALWWACYALLKSGWKIKN